MGKSKSIMCRVALVANSTKCFQIEESDFDQAPTPTVLISMLWRHIMETQKPEVSEHIMKVAALGQKSLDKFLSWYERRARSELRKARKEAKARVVAKDCSSESSNRIKTKLRGDENGSQDLSLPLVIDQDRSEQEVVTKIPATINRCRGPEIRELLFQPLYSPRSFLELSPSQLTSAAAGDLVATEFTTVDEGLFNANPDSRRVESIDQDPIVDEAAARNFREPDDDLVLGVGDKLANRIDLPFFFHCCWRHFCCRKFNGGFATSENCCCCG